MGIIRHPVFAKRFKTALRLRGWSQYKAARELGVCEATICHWVKGRYFPRAIEDVCEIAQKLNVTVDFLVGASPIAAPVKTTESPQQEP